MNVMGRKRAVLRGAPAKTASLNGHGTMRARFVDALKRLAAETTGSTVIEYALTLAGIALSASGVAAAIGVDISAIFDDLQLELCKQAYNVCVGH